MRLRPLFRLTTCALVACALSATSVRAGEDEPAGKAKPVEETKPAGEKAKPAKDGKAKKSQSDLRKDIEELVRRGGRLPEGFQPRGSRMGGGGVRWGPGGGPGPASGRRGPGGMGSRGMPGRGSGGMGFGPMLGGDAAQGAMTKAMGKILLKYLDAKDDPVKGPVYEELLRDLATMLAKGDANALQQMGPRLMGRFLSGMQDPKKAPVYREIMQIFGEAMTDAVRRPAPPTSAPQGGPPAPPTFNPPNGPPAPPSRGAGPAAPPRGPFAARAGAWPRTFAGAELTYVRQDATSRAMVGVLRRIPEDSPAHAAGLKPGDMILAVNGKPANPAALKKADAAFVPGGKLRLRLRRMNGTLEVLDLEFEADESEAPEAPAAAPKDK